MLCFYKAKTVSLALGYSLLKAKNNKKTVRRSVFRTCGSVFSEDKFVLI
jgi:hypothetical protein